MKKIMLLFAATLLLASCSETTQNVVIDNRYSMDIPEGLTTTTELNDIASLQYQDMVNELYVVVIDEPIKDINDAIVEMELQDTYTPDLSGYTKLILEDFIPAVAPTTKTEPVDATINGMKAKTYTMEADVEGTPAFYKVAYVQGKDTYYQILTWTLTSKKDEYGEKMDKMIQSFKEI
jgi:hypothetical protein